MNSKPLGRMENDMKKWMNVFLVMFILVNLVGCGKRWESKDNTDMERDGQTVNNLTGSQSNIDYGIEVRVDISGDGKTDRVRVVDTVSGDYAFTQVFLFKILSLAQNSLLASVKGMDFPALGHPS